MAGHDAGLIGRHNARVSASFTRPADTLVYASGDLVANNTVAGSVVPMALALSRLPGIGGEIRRARLRKSGAVLTAASFRIHLYNALPVPANGDNGVWLTDKANNAIGRFDVTIDEAYSDGAAGYAAPGVGTEINFVADTVYALIEARAAYVPASGEIFTLELEVQQN
jgi:hypothetical protein